MQREGMTDGSGRSEFMADVLKGAVAGAAAVWIMDRVDWWMYRQENPEARQQTRHARPGGKDPAHAAAGMAAKAAGGSDIPQPHPSGVAVHYALGIGPGALFGAFRDRLDVLGPTRGPIYGLSLFLLQDELINAAAGLSGKPKDYPWQAHTRGLASHFVLGVATETALWLLEGPGRRMQRFDE